MSSIKSAMREYDKTASVIAQEPFTITQLRAQVFEARRDPLRMHLSHFGQTVYATLDLKTNYTNELSQLVDASIVGAREAARVLRAQRVIFKSPEYLPGAQALDRAVAAHQLFEITRLRRGRAWQLTVNRIMPHEMDDIRIPPPGEYRG
jgi:hypothetical protein